jgi:hypothetical protein
MLHKNDRRNDNDELDRLGGALVRASSLTEDESEHIASSPFLSAKLRARMDAGRNEIPETGDWLDIFGAAWRALAAMSFAAALAVAALLFAGSVESPTPGIFTQEALLATSDTGSEGLLFDDADAISSDEAFSNLVNENERSTAK